MNKYAAFSDRFNGVPKILAQDLRGGRYFLIQEGRYVSHDKGKFFYENGERAPAHRVWEGNWPKGTFDTGVALSIVQESVRGGDRGRVHRKQHTRRRA